MGNYFAEVEAQSIEEGLNKGLPLLGTSIEQVGFDIVCGKQRRLFSWHSKPYKLRILLKGRGDLSAEALGEEMETTMLSLNEQDAIEKILAVTNQINSFCKIDFLADGVYLTVYPAGMSGRRLTFDEVKRELDFCRIQQVDLKVVRTAVADSNGQAVKIAGPQAEIMEDGAVLLNVSKDKMEATVTVMPPLGRGKPVTPEDIRKALAAEKIVYGIKEEVIDTLCDGKQHNNVLIAAGVPPVNGQDAVFTYNFQIEKEYKPKELGDGRVDFREINSVENVRAGTELVRKTPPTPGTEGFNVYGEKIPAKPGKDKPFSYGKNVAVSQDGLSLVAQVEGQLKLDNQGRISVLPVLEVENVDFTVGNLDFVGNIVVKGDVCDGFTVKAAGNIEVRGSVGAATIIAGGGLKVARGIVGKEKCFIKANDDVYANFIENANIQTAGSVYAGEAIMHSTISAEKSVVAGGRRGLIVGGLIRSGEEVTAKVIGSEMATRTEIEVGVNPQLKEEFIRLDAELQNCDDNLYKTQQALRILRQIKAKTGQLPPDKAEMLRKLETTWEYLQNQQRTMLERQQQISARMQESKQGRVTATEVIYPGTKITIRNSILRVEQKIKCAVLQEDEGEVRTGPYVPER